MPAQSNHKSEVKSFEVLQRLQMMHGTAYIFLIWYACVTEHIQLGESSKNSAVSTKRRGFTELYILRIYLTLQLIFIKDLHETKTL